MFYVLKIDLKILYAAKYFEMIIINGIKMVKINK